MSFEMPESDSTLTIEMKVLGKITVDKGNETISDGAISITNKDGKEITYADEGEEVTITIKHTKSVEKVTVNGISATLVEEGVYTFNMPTGDANVVIEWSNKVKVKLEGGFTDVGIDFRNVDENGLILSTVNIDWTTYTAELEIGQRYMLRLSPYSGYQVDSVLLNGVTLEPDTTVRSAYYFICDSTTTLITINTSKVTVTYNISLNLEDTGIDPSTVKIEDYNENQITSSEADAQVYVYFQDTEKLPSNLEVIGDSGTPYAATPFDNGASWFFYMPKENVTITPIIESEEPELSPILTIINNTGESIFNYPGGYMSGDGLFSTNGEGPYEYSSDDTNTYIYSDLDTSLRYDLWFSSNNNTTFDISWSDNVVPISGPTTSNFMFEFTGEATITFSIPSENPTFTFVNETDQDVIYYMVGDYLNGDGLYQGESNISIVSGEPVELEIGKNYVFRFTYTTSMGVRIDGDVEYTKDADYQYSFVFTATMVLTIYWAN